MSSHNLTISLKPRKDMDGQTFYVGKIKAPMSIDCKDGVVFLVFIADEKEEQIQIASMDKKENNNIRDQEE